jgi:hypothetical protein
MDSSPRSPRESASIVDDIVTAPLPDVPVDSVIKDMDPIFTRKLHNISIESYYKTGWAEEDAPLYGPWLERKGSFDVSVSQWEHSKEGFQHSWSGETFHQKRVRGRRMIYHTLIQATASDKSTTVYRSFASSSSAQRTCTLVLLLLG